MRPSVWKDAARDFIISYLKTSKHSDCHIWADYMTNHNDSRYYENFVKYLHEHDHYRGLDFKKTFSELAQFI
jgi:hypothetical protein